MSYATSRRPDLRRAVLAVAIVCCAGAAAAQERGSAADQEACTPDVFRLCNDFIPDEPRIVACLQSKREQLSPACGKVFAPAPTRGRKRRLTSQG